ncbi:MAG TPA: hypothetical protein QKA08_02790 [Candidatus Megaira endosymbiont of Nemacystus decipiens]|nr:hypothetical protein [Candidatus Megaera endosymbiont of Nemacystus decipiens]
MSDKNDYLYDTIVGNAWFFDKNILVEKDDQNNYKKACIKINSIKLNILLFTEESDFLKNQSIIDLLIINSTLKYKLDRFVISNVINLTQSIFTDDDIFFPLPLKLQSLLTIIEKIITSDLLFCRINNKWIYSEKQSCILSLDKKIILTGKENQIVKSIINNNFKIEISALRQKVWGHNIFCESSTVETHLYRLKQKLPSNFLHFDNKFVSFLSLD